GLPDDGTVMLVAKGGNWERRSATDLGVVASSETALGPAETGAASYSTHGAYYGRVIFEQVTAWPIPTSPGSANPLQPDLRAATVDGPGAGSLTIPADGKTVASSFAGRIYLASTGADQTGGEPVQLMGNDAVTWGGLAFVGPNRLISAAGSGIALW